MILNAQQYISFNDIFIVLLAIIVYYSIKFYINVHRYPKGPLPIPFVGSLRIFLNRKENPFFFISRVLADYGPISTLWVLNKPVVFICDLDSAKKLFCNNNAFLGRIENRVEKLLLQKNAKSILFSDASPTWASLRKIGHIAIRKIVKNVELPLVLSDIVDETMLMIQSKIGNDCEFDPLKYIEIIVTKINAFSAFGKRYSTEDKDFKLLVSSIKKISRNVDNIVFAEQFLIYSIFKYRIHRETDELFLNIFELIRKYFKNQLVCEDRKDICFCGTLKNFKQEVISGDADTANYLNDSNLCSVIFDLFLAGTQTTIYTLHWVFLILANHSSMQKKMRQEIAEKIGDRKPVQEDMNKCHFTRAFLSEVLRYRNVLPIGVPHATTCDSKLGSYNIPKGTTIVAFNHHFLNDKNHWQNPMIFDPMRFMINGKFDSSIVSNFAPFGFGRRMCLGDKYFQRNAFFILVRSLQSTKGLNFKLPKGPGSGDLEPFFSFTFMAAKKYKLILDIDNY